MIKNDFVYWNDPENINSGIYKIAKISSDKFAPILLESFTSDELFEAFIDELKIANDFFCCKKCGCYNLHEIIKRDLNTEKYISYLKIHCPKCVINISERDLVTIKDFYVQKEIEYYKKKLKND